MVLVHSLGYRGERPAPRALQAPRRRDDSHAVDALDGADDVDAAEQRPPARPGLFHEAEAVEPSALPERRRVAAELAAVQLEAEHPQPVPQAQEPDIAGIPRGVLARGEELAKAPERERVEPGDDHLALRHQYAFGFA